MKREVTFLEATRDEALKTVKILKNQLYGLESKNAEIDTLNTLLRSSEDVIRQLETEKAMLLSLQGTDNDVERVKLIDHLTKQNFDLSEKLAGLRMECPICMVDECNTAFRECGHRICIKCSETMLKSISPKCHQCRRTVSAIIKIY